MISVCIPVKNGGDLFRENLQRLFAQRISEPLEIVVMDSGSTDDTVETARSSGARVYSIPAEEFNHGETRNRLAELALGEILVFTAQDATPIGDSFLHELASPLRQEPELAGACGQQIPRPEADPVTRFEIELYNRSFFKGMRRKRIQSIAEFLRSTLAERIDCVAFDNVCSAMPRRVWEKFSFSRIEFAEDIDWAFRVLAQGGVILHNPAARVYHSHRYTPFSRLRRHFISQYVIRRIVQMPPESFPGRAYEEFCAISAFIGDIEHLCQQLSRCSGVVKKAQLPKNFSYWLRRVLRKLDHRGLNRLASRLLPGILWQDLRLHFNLLVKEIVQSHLALTPADTLALLRQLEACAIGDFLGRYYYSASVKGRLTPWQKEVIRILTRPR